MEPGFLCQMWTVANKTLENPQAPYHIRVNFFSINMMMNRTFIPFTIATTYGQCCQNHVAVLS